MCGNKKIIKQRKRKKGRSRLSINGAVSLNKRVCFEVGFIPSLLVSRSRSLTRIERSNRHTRCWLWHSPSHFSTISLHLFVIPFHSVRSFYEKKRPDEKSSVLPCPTKDEKIVEGHDGPNKRKRRHVRHHHHNFSALQQQKWSKESQNRKVQSIKLASKRRITWERKTNGNYSSPRRQDVNESRSQIKLYTH